MTATYLPAGMPAPEADALTRPFWEGLKQHRILVQRCTHCNTWQWGPEWICHACHAFDPAWVEIAGAGRIDSFARIWHPVHPALEGHGPYLAVIVTIADAGGIRMVGNLLGDPKQDVTIGSRVLPVFEDQPDAATPHTLLQWTLARD